MESWQTVSGYGRLCGLDDGQLECVKPLWLRIEANPEARLFFDRCFEGLLNGTLKEEEIHQVYQGRELAEFQLLLVLSLYPAGEANYRQRGWPPAMLGEAAGDMAIWVRHHVENFGYPGLQWRIVSWLRGFFVCTLIQLGRLQCNTAHAFDGPITVFRAPSGEIRICDTAPGPDWVCALRPHDPTINIHIPASGPLRPADCKASVRRMVRFFAEFLPDYDYRAVVCHSWFLDRQLQDILKPGSNILQFQEWGHLFDFDEPSETIWRVFGEKGVREGVNAVPHVTDMQKRMAAFVNNGGEFKSGGMFILRAEIAERCAES